MEQKTEMRIGVNLLPFRKQLTGTGRFTQNILSEFAAIDKKNTYFLFLTKTSEPHFSMPAENFFKIVNGLSPNFRLIRIGWEQFLLPWQLRRHQIQILFTPSVAIPCWVPCKTVTVIHDLAPFHKSLIKYSKIRAVYVRWATMNAVKRSTAIIAVSENTKREIVRFCHIPEAKIFVSYEGVNEFYHKINSAELIMQTRIKYNLPERFILFVGTLEPGKNLFRLLQAFHQLKKNNLIPHKLVIVGAYGWGKIFNNKTQSLKDEIIFTGYVSEQDLQLIYNAAELFILPSLYEGFGLPPLEAMACGTPVIVSNCASLPEVVGDAGLLINPYDINEIAGAILRVLNDKNLQTELITKGFKRAKKFTWQKTASLILEVFDKVGRKH